MENTIENKQRFFAQYWGQEVLAIKWDDLLRPVNYINIEGIQEDWLELTPLSLISDEDAIEVAKIRGGQFDGQHEKSINFKGELKEYYTSNMISYGKEAVTYFLSGYASISPQKTTNIVDYLRSKGYYIGDGTEIEYGWVKLKTE